MQSQREPWACFPATRQSHVGIIGNSDTRIVLRNHVLVAVAAENPAS